MTHQPVAYEHEKVRCTVQNYVDGYIQKDTDLLRRTFSEGAKLMSVDNGNISEVLCSDWFLKLEERKKSGVVTPAATSQIMSIQQTGNAAIASVRLTFPTFSFTDYLSLLKTNLGWRIVGKIYEAKI